MTADLGAQSAVHPGEAGVVVFEPRGGRPAREEPLIAPFAELLSRKGRAAALQSSVLLVALVVMFVVPGARAGAVLPVLVIALAGAWTAFASHAWWRCRRGVRERLLELPIRLHRFHQGDLLATRGRVCLRLASGPDEQWVAFRPASVYVPFLARKGRVWVLGPEPSGWVAVFVPGMVLGIMGRVQPQPIRGARPVEPVPPRLAAPEGDAVLRSFLRFQGRVGVSFVAVCVILAAVLTVAYLPVLRAAQPWPQALWPGFAVALALCLLALALGALPGLARRSDATRAITWIPLPITLDGPLNTNAVRANTTGRVLLPDGTQGRARFRRMHANLAATVRASGRIWVIGGARPNGAVVIGVPGHPLLGFGILDRN